MKPCPYCAELIQDQAAKCRYCGEWLDPSKRPAWSQEAKAAAIATVPVGDGTDRLVDDDDDGPEGTAATLPVGSGALNLGRREAEAPRTWSAPAWLANAQAARNDPREEQAASDRSTLEEVALRMERIRQSAAAVREGAEASPRAIRPSAPDRATLEVEPGVTLPAGSLRALGVDPRDAGRPVRGREAARAVANKPAPVVHEDELADFDDEPAPRPRPRPERDDLVLRSERPTVPDIPRAQLLAEVTQAQVARQRQELLARAERPTHNKRVMAGDDHDLDDLDDRALGGQPTERVVKRKGLPPEPELPGPPTERAIKRRPPSGDDFPVAPRKTQAAVSPRAAYDEDDDELDDLDEDAPPRPAGAGFDDDFLDDEEGDEDDDPEGGYEDFGAPGPAPRPLPWRPILIAAAVIVVAGVLLFRPYLFPDDAETDEVAEAEAGDAAAEAQPEAAPEPAAKLPGEGQPVQPDAKADAGAGAVADPGQLPPPAQPAALDADTKTKLDEARKAYAASEGNVRKLQPVSTKLQEVLAKAPDDPDALTLMAQVQLEQNKLDDALATSTRCTQVAPTSAACWLTIGVIQETKGADQIARVAYQKYLDLAPDGRYANDARKALSRLK